MATVAPSRGAAAWIAAHKKSSIAVLFIAALAAALGIATLRSDGFADRAGQLGTTLGRQIGNGAQSVAQLFAARSPGERAAGLLASLKGRRLPALHERALPKVRKPGSPLYAAVVPPPAMPPIIPVPPAAAAPLFNTVAAAPVPPPAETVTGPPFFGPPPGLPGGPGLVFPPQITPPGPPVTPPVPEPTTWAMTLLGFALIGRALKRSRLPAQHYSLG